MTTNITILIVHGQSEPWRSSALKVREVIAAAEPPQYGDASLTVLLCESLLNIPYGLATRPHAPTCVICHLDQETETAALDHCDDYLWILVSGGQHVVSAAFRQAMRDRRVIWFQGAYKREANFVYWLRYWASKGFDHDQFCHSADALLIGASGAQLQLLQLRQSLTPLTLLVEAYSYLQEPVDPSNSVQVCTELFRALAELLQDKSLLDVWSSQATLLDGYLENHKAVLSDSSKAVRDALYPFLPHDYGHFGDYSPKMDLDLIAVSTGTKTPVETMRIVKKWRERLSRPILLR
jgi:hypothetical protein